MPFLAEPGEPGQSALHTLLGELPLTELASRRSKTANIAAMKTPPPLPTAVLLWTVLPSLSLTTLSPTKMPPPFPPAELSWTEDLS